MPTGPKSQRRPADVIGNAIRWLRSRPGAALRPALVREILAGSSGRDP